VSSCHDYLIEPGNTIRSSKVGNATEFTASCDVLAAETYRVKAKVECNFEKIRATTKPAHVLAITPSFKVRTGRDHSGDWYQIYLDQPWGDSNEIISFGDDIRGGSTIFFHEGHCSEGSFMEFVVDQVHLEKRKSSLELFLVDRR
jgi:hypothetical protein